MGNCWNSEDPKTNLQATNNEQDLTSERLPKNIQKERLSSLQNNNDEDCADLRTIISGVEEQSISEGIPMYMPMNGGQDCKLDLIKLSEPADTSGI
jgi:hypothetical protein